MDEEVAFADPLSYAEDIPYESQVDLVATTAKSDRLKERIGNRIYLIEDALTKKRRRLDEEIQEDIEEPNESMIEEDMAGRVHALPFYGLWE